MDIQGTIQIDSDILADIKAMIDILNSKEMQENQNEVVGSDAHIQFTLKHYRLEKFLTSLGFVGAFVYPELARRNMDYSETYTTKIQNFIVTSDEGILIKTELVEDWEDDGDGRKCGYVVTNQHYHYSIYATIQI